MPNAAKLVAALGMGGLGFIVSLLIMDLFPEDTNFGWFIHVNVALGLFVGWVVTGSRAGRGMVPAMNTGMTSAVVLIFWGLFVQSCNEMVRLAMKNRFDGAMEALIAVFEIGAEYAVFMSTLTIWAVIMGGGLLVGVLTEYAWRTWR